MTVEQEMVTITKKEYTLLKNASKFLECLDNAGVDCWDGFEIAREEYESIPYEDGKTKS